MVLTPTGMPTTPVSCSDPLAQAWQPPPDWLGWLDKVPLLKMMYARGATVGDVIEALTNDCVHAWTLVNANAAMPAPVHTMGPSGPIQPIGAQPSAGPVEFQPFFAALHETLKNDPGHAPRWPSAAWKLMAHVASSLRGDALPLEGMATASTPDWFASHPVKAAMARLPRADRAKVKRIVNAMDDRQSMPSIIIMLCEAMRP